MEQPLNIISVNVGGRREVEWAGQKITTGIFKQPVPQRVRAAGVNLEGDDQADRTVHGGPDKSIYGFPSEHYPSWRETYPDSDLSWGAFGENLTTAGLLEQAAIIGACYQCGDLKLRITEPRMPCLKLSVRLANKTVIKQMLKTGHTGFYFAIESPGTVQAGDQFELVETPAGGISVTVLTDLYRTKTPDPSALAAALAAPHVPDSWRQWLQERQDQIAS